MAALIAGPAWAQNGFDQGPRGIPETTQQPGGMPGFPGGLGTPGPVPGGNPGTMPQPGGVQPGFPGGLGNAGPGSGGYPGTAPQPGGRQPGGQGGGVNQAQLMQLARMELQDYGVQPVQRLHDGPMHAPTPASIPGARVITTADLVQLAQSGQPFLVFDTLGGDDTLPGAYNAVGAAQGGTFQDQTQQMFGQFLQQTTRGRQDVPMIFYCLSTQCWMSYNASLRAANLGYRNVFWYRGGIEAWSQAGLPTVPRQQ
jgi:rhodanese-related sulfurtransferase